MRKTIPFNQLSASNRERFIQCTRQAALPVPLLSENLGGRRAVGSGILLVCAVAGLAVLVFYEFGATSDFGLQSPAFAGGYFAALFLGAYSILAILRHAALARAVPFVPGRYLFPMDYVEATTHELVVMPMSSMTDFGAEHLHSNGAYVATTFKFTFADGTRKTMSVLNKEVAERALAGLRAVQYELRAAVEQGDAQKLYHMDVFYEARQNDWQPVPFASGVGPEARAVPALLRRAGLVALVAGAVAAGPLWYVRDMFSDEAAFARLEKDSPFGARHRIYEINRYAENGGDRGKTALKKFLPLAELAEAKEVGSVTAFREVTKKHPGHAVAAEARKEIAKLYEKTIATFRGKAAPDPKMRDFMDKLFAYLQAHDTPRTLVRFGKPSSTDLEKADAELQKKVTGGVVPIAGHFSEASVAPREKAIVGILRNAFATIFPADMFDLEQGPALGAAAAASVANGAPTIEIQYEVKSSGDVYTSEKTNKNFVGILVSFAVTMKIPDQADSFSFKLQVAPPDRFSVETDDSFGAYTGDSAGAVYHAMTTHAFQQLSTRLKAVFFESGGVDVPAQAAE